MDRDEDKIKKAQAARRANARDIATRLGVFFIVVLLAFVGLSFRLFSITRDNKNEYRQKILSQKSYDSKTINAKRGDILDANGNVLAASQERYNIILDARQIRTLDDESGDKKVRTATLSALRSVFNVDYDALNKYIDDNPGSAYYEVVKGITYEDLSRFLPYITEPSATEKDSLYDPNVKGVWYQKYYVRYYPQKTLACDVIGFSKSEGQASYGLEEQYNDILTGTSGREYGFFNDETTYEVTTIPAVDGNTLVTTIDTNVQMIVEKHLKNFCEEYKDNYRKGLGANNVGCIVMRADSGEILAMASYPNYDLNDNMNISHLYTDEEIAAMKEEGTLKDAYDKLWKNFCITDTYEPGSVMKPFTVAMGLESGKLNGSEVYYCGGFLQVADHKIYCHGRKAEGNLTVKEAVAKSCNVALMQMADTIGKETFLEYQGIFNLGLKTNIDLAGESRTDGLVFNDKTMNVTELATASFGQGFNVTMIQMAAGYAALVNGGYYYEPHVVSKILSPSGSVVKNIEPRLVKQIVSSSTSEKIIEYCNSVVTDGTGWRAKPAGYSIGGKTGTAETVPRDNGEYVVSFMCHAPADHPEIICYVVVDRPNVREQDDAKYSSIISRQILTEILPYLNIPMTEEVSDKEREELLALELSIYTNRVEQEDAEADVSDNNPEGEQ